MEPRWRLPDPSTLVWECWGTEYSLFDRDSGATHLVSELPAEILRRLSPDPTTTSDLAAAIAADCEIDCDPAWRLKIERILQDLHALSLIEQAAG